MDRDFTRIVNQYSDMLLRISMHYLPSRQDAEDIVQQVFLKLVENNLQFISREHEKAWLIRVCINLCKDFLKAAYNRRVESGTEDNDAVTEIEIPDNSMIDYIKQLPENQRIAIYLFYYEDRPVAEIAQIMKTKQNTVLSWLNRGRKTLKKLIGEEYNCV